MININRVLKKLISFPGFYLILLILFAFCIRVYNLGYNAPFLDEAIYIRLGEEFFNGLLASRYPYSWVGGLPIFYPPLSAIAYFLGGIIGSRFVNVILGTCSIYLIYFFAKQLQLFKENNFLNKLTGLFTGMFFAILPISIFLSRYAIYDMLSFTIFLLGIVLAQKAAIGKEQNNYYYVSAIALVLSFFAKYTIIIFLPFICLILLLFTLQYKRKQLEETIVFILVIFLGVGYYIWKNFSDLQQFLSQQVVNRNTTSVLDILILFVTLTAVWYMVAAVGVLLSIYRKQYQSAVLFFLSFIPVVVHMVTNNTATFQQDMIFTFLCLTPLVAVVFVWICQKYLVFGSMFAIGIALFIFISTASNRYDFEHHWPDSTEAMLFLQQHVSPGDTVLAEADDVAFIALNNKLSANNIVGPYNFTYKNVSNAPAYMQSVKDKYFTYIELEKSDNTFEKTILPLFGNNYKIVYNKGSFIMYKKQ